MSDPQLRVHCFLTIDSSPYLDGLALQSLEEDSKKALRVAKSTDSGEIQGATRG